MGCAGERRSLAEENGFPSTTEKSKRGRLYGTVGKHKNTDTHTGHIWKREGGVKRKGNNEKHKRLAQDPKTRVENEGSNQR